MKTAILQAVLQVKTAKTQQFSGKNRKNFYHDQFLKKVKLQCHCKIVQNFQVKTK